MLKLHATPSEHKPDQDDAAKEIDSKDLLGGNKQIKIRHEGQLYELRLTRLGKLILTK